MNELKLGEIKTIRSNGGKKLEFVELLFDKNTNVQLLVNRDKKDVEMKINDIDLMYKEFSCRLDKNILHDYIVNLIEIEKELIKSEEDV